MEDCMINPPEPYWDWRDDEEEGGPDYCEWSAGEIGGEPEETQC